MDKQELDNLVRIGKLKAEAASRVLAPAGLRYRHAMAVLPSIEQGTRDSSGTAYFGILPT
jgi:hypothetical protein